MLDLQSMMGLLEQWGLVDIILPFILIFTIVFAVFEQTKILSKEHESNRKYSTLIAIVVAFSVVMPHITGTYYFGFDPVTVINRALPQVGLLLVAIVMMLLTLGLWTGKKADGSKGAGVWFSLISGAIVLIIFIASLGYWQLPQWLLWILSSDVLALVIAILVFGFVIKWISSGKKEEKKTEDKDKDAMKNFRKFLEG